MANIDTPAIDSHPSVEYSNDMDHSTDAISHLPLKEAIPGWNEDEWEFALLGRADSQRFFVRVAAYSSDADSEKEKDSSAIEDEAAVVRDGAVTKTRTRPPAKKPAGKRKSSAATSRENRPKPSKQERMDRMNARRS